MTIKLYTGRDSEGRPWPPDHQHEAQALIEIVKKLWLAFDSRQEVYALVANLHRPSADLVLLSHRGIGVVELKHYGGRIHRKGNTWYAYDRRIKAGAESSGYRNPHEQVQAYAKEIRKTLIPEGRKPWLPGRYYQQQSFKFNTAVCFTHPDAEITRLRESMRKSPVSTQPWENFAVLKSDDVANWVPSMRFEVTKGRTDGYEHPFLHRDKIVRIAEDALGGTEWTQIHGLMPTGEPYGYLTLIEGERRMQTFSLDRESLTLGRDADILIPEQFRRVSREHAQIQRTLDGVTIEDLDSRNNTYINRVPVRRPRPLEHGAEITLGGPDPSSKVCLLVFTMNTPIEPAMTEGDTTIV